MSGSFCLSQQLNAELEYLFNMYCFKIGRLSGVGSQGNVTGSSGGKVLSGHLHFSPSSTPVFSHLITSEIAAHKPTAGKL